MSLIRLPTETAHCVVVLTVEEYEHLEREVLAQAVIDPTLGTWILAALVEGARWRYLEVKRERRE